MIITSLWVISLWNQAFLDSNNLSNLVKSNTCFKGKGSCIDLSLTNRRDSFRFSESYDTITCDHHMI